MSDKALVLFSGGQDSATSLVWALSRFNEVDTVAFDYGQSHVNELSVRLDFLEKFKNEFPELAKKLVNDFLIDMKEIGNISTSSLTSENPIETNENGLPNTFVPGRNLLFFTIASTLAYKRGSKHLVGGMCETDFSGYPDCRDDAIKALQVALNIGMDQRFVLHTPLMWINKSETWDLANTLGGDKLIELIREYTHTCYRGDRSVRHEWGYGCNECDACELRRIGWENFIEDKAV
jgi:7-cyano-7-deazaguanine synthase